MPSFVGVVCLSCVIAQVGNGIVCSVSVEMANFHPARAWTEKSLGDKLVDHLSELSARLEQPHLWILAGRVNRL